MSTDWDVVSQEEIFEEAKNITPKRGDEMKTIADNLIEQGREEGRKKGREEGREKGIKEGKKSESLEVVIELLERKLKSPLSEELREGLENTTYSQLKLIRLSIFEVESEKDVFELLEK